MLKRILSSLAVAAVTPAILMRLINHAPASSEQTVHADGSVTGVVTASWGSWSLGSYAFASAIVFAVCMAIAWLWSQRRGS
ncbi:hypothetical protein [Paenibacillus soyae]|uniref:Uncharacterized protein n=1 Tax=Paenibacillus soyae TaxID=2969249 RepID=A0A9X2MUP0_9BACL|nr:hypothetical protein [Paenibacillus soyae]MCR2806609.1 hypothetical protein [Paenibacillus soyae]